MSAPAILDYLSAMNARKASDMYITVGFAPALRIENRLETLREEPVTIEEVNDIVSAILSNRQKRDFERKMELNTSLNMGAHGRFRINALRQRQTSALVIRRIISRIPDFQELMLPDTLKSLSLLKRGLVLVTGMTGSGKSTTLACMINHRNISETGHIITIEDPIEYYHDHKKSVITQREIGVDTETYSIALKNALRQRPDVIMIGEIRDREVMEQVITASETGHLCLATLHTNNAYQAIERMVNLFPEEYHNQVRLSLASNLRAIISQRLVPSENGSQSLALEIMLNEGHVKDLIQDGTISKIRDIMEQNRHLGMCSFDQSLLDMYRQGLISEETALAHADMPGDTRFKIQQIKISGSGSGDSLQSMDTSKLSISE